jgi:uncharacterized small protein (DUF1192 family)
MLAYERRMVDLVERKSPRISLRSGRATLLPWASTNMTGGTTMPDYSALSLAELDNRIAVARDNIRQLIEQAAAASGERNEERISERLAQQNDELEALSKARDVLSAKR